MSTAQIQPAVASVGRLDLDLHNFQIEFDCGCVATAYGREDSVLLFLLNHVCRGVNGPDAVSERSKMAAKRLNKAAQRIVDAAYALVQADKAFDAQPK